MVLEDSSLGAQTTPINSQNIPDEKELEQKLPTLPKKSGSDYVYISLLCMLVAFGGFVFGFDTGTISGFVNMSDFKQRFGQRNSSGEYYLSDVRTGLLVSIFNVGCAVGGIFLSKIGDVKGRRIGIMTSAVIYIVGIVIQISSSSKWYQYFIGRLVTGLAVGTLSVLSPLFISESSPKHLRGTLVCCYQLMVTLGIFLGYCTNYGTKVYTDSRQWRIPLGLCFAWALVLIWGMLGMPESPRFLVEKGRLEDAKNSVAKSNKVSPEDAAVYTEIQLIQAGIDREALAGKAGWMELIKGKPKMLQRVIIGIMLQSIQQLSGNNYFFYYGTTIFQGVGMNDSFQAAIVLGVVNFASTFVGIYAIERMGRRLCLLVGSACMSVCFLIYSLLGTQHLYKNGYEATAENTYKPTGNAMIFITCLFIFFFASTWAGGVYTIVSETYPLRVRSKGMAVATAANWMWGFLISFFTPFITSAIHFYYGFVFTGCLIFSFFYVYFCLRETKGLSLEEVDELYATDISPWKTAGWVPPGTEQMAHSTGYAGEAKPKPEHV